MKWIVKSDFYRTAQLADVEIIDACKGATKQPPHANHFHMGAIIELGKSENESELQTGRKDSNETKRLIAQLRVAGRIGDASDKDAVARVESDVATENKRLAAQEKANKQTDALSLVQALTAALSAKAAPAK